MHLLLSVLFIALSTVSIAQHVDNIKVKQDGGIIYISYDLDDEPSKYYDVNLKMSGDSGKTFSDNLRLVSGDIRNTTAGTSKQIIWNAKDELAYFDGEMIFKIEAQPKEFKLPDALEKGKARVELTEVKRVGKNITIDFLITPLSDCSILLHGDSKIWDYSGNFFGLSNGMIGYTQVGAERPLIVGVPVKSQISFQGINENETSIALLKIKLRILNYGYPEYDFRSVPISK